MKHGLALGFVFKYLVPNQSKKLKTDFDDRCVCCVRICSRDSKYSCIPLRIDIEDPLASLEIDILNVFIRQQQHLMSQIRPCCKLNESWVPPHVRSDLNQIVKKIKLNFVVKM